MFRGLGTEQQHAEIMKEGLPLNILSEEVHMKWPALQEKWCYHKKSKDVDEKVQLWAFIARKGQIWGGLV